MNLLHSLTVGILNHSVRIEVAAVRLWNSQLGSESSGASRFLLRTAALPSADAAFTYQPALTPGCGFHRDRCPDPREQQLRL